MNVGDVVRHIASNTLITIVRLIGDEENAQFTQMDRRYESSGFAKGDPNCIWFHESEMRSGVFKKKELELVDFDSLYGGSAAGSVDDLDLDLGLDDLDLGLDDLDLGLDDLDLDLGDDFDLNLDLGDDLDLDLGLDDDFGIDTDLDFGSDDFDFGAGLEETAGDPDLDLGLADDDFDFADFGDEEIDLDAIAFDDEPTLDFDFGDDDFSFGDESSSSTSNTADDFSFGDESSSSTSNTADDFSFGDESSSSTSNDFSFDDDFSFDEGKKEEKKGDDGFDFDF